VRSQREVNDLPFAVREADGLGRAVPAIYQTYSVMEQSRLIVHQKQEAHQVEWVQISVCRSAKHMAERIRTRASLGRVRHQTLERTARLEPPEPHIMDLTCPADWEVYARETLR
jgi:hypothetical protein